jgi:hypothetical protein
MLSKVEVKSLESNARILKLHQHIILDLYNAAFFGPVLNGKDRRTVTAVDFGFFILLQLQQVPSSCCLNAKSIRFATFGCIAIHLSI